MPRLMQKHTKALTKISGGIVFLGICLFAITWATTLTHNDTVNANPSANDITNTTPTKPSSLWYNSRDTGGQGGGPASNFEVVNTKTIRDNGTKQLYTTDAVIAYDAANSNGGLRDGYFFWPQNYSFTPDASGKCLGGILAVRNQGNFNQFEYIPLKPELNAADQKLHCVTDLGVDPSGYTGSMNDLSNIPDIPAYGFNTWSVNQQKALMGLFDWKGKSVLELTGFDETYTPVNGQEAKNLKDYLLNHAQYNDLKNIVNTIKLSDSKTNINDLFYTNDVCKNDDKLSHKVYIVVDPGDKSTAWIIHQGGNNSWFVHTTDDGDLHADWWGGDQSCLFNNTSTLVINPLGYLGSPYSDKAQQAGADSTSHINQLDMLKTVVTVPVDPNTGASLQGGTPLSGPQSSTQSCEQDGGSLAWIMCKVLDLLADGVGGVYSNLIEPMLQVDITPTSTGGQHLKAAWSSFRIFGNIFLVIVLLVMVFGESIGGGMIDAYTVKKVLPRLLAAAILINVSYYLVALVVDISNIVGNGLGLLITKGFGINNGSGFSFSFANLNGSTQASTTGLTIGGVVISSADIWTSFAAVAAKGGLVKFALMLLDTVFIPLFLLVLAIAGTLAFRIGLIFLLTLFSPIAFALWALPNTEKYFKKWWGLLQESALVFPIIASLFALSTVMAQTTIWGTGSKGGLIGAAGFFVSLIMVVAPLVLIPFAFKIAGGLLGKIHEFASGASKRIGESGALKRRKEHSSQQWNDRKLQARDKIYDKLQTGGRGSQWTARRFAGQRNIKAEVSEMKARIGKEMEAQNATGDDTEQRAFTVNMAWALKQGVEGEDWKIDEKTGKRVFKTLAGKWVTEASVRAAHARWDGNQGAMDWSLAHEMDKATTQEEQDRVRAQYDNLTTGDTAVWRMTKEQSGSVWLGAAYAKQNVNRQWKYYAPNEDGKLELTQDGALRLIRDVDEKQGNYQMSMNNADTWTTMTKSMLDATAKIDELEAKPRQDLTDKEQTILLTAHETLERGARIAHSLEVSSGAGLGVGNVGEDGTPTYVPIPIAPAPPPNVPPIGGSAPPVPPGAIPPATRGAIPTREVGAGGPARVQEEMQTFLQTMQQVKPYRAPIRPGDANETRNQDGTPTNSNETLDRRAQGYVDQTTYADGSRTPDGTPGETNPDETRGRKN